MPLRSKIAPAARLAASKTAEGGVLTGPEIETWLAVMAGGLLTNG